MLKVATNSVNVRKNCIATGLLRGTHIKSYYSGGDIYTQRAQYTSLLFFYGPQFYIPVEGAAKLSMCHNEALFLVLHSLPTNVALLLWRVSKKLESVPRNDVSLGMQSCIKTFIVVPKKKFWTSRLTAGEFYFPQCTA